MSEVLVVLQRNLIPWDPERHQHKIVASPTVSAQVLVSKIGQKLNLTCTMLSFWKLEFEQPLEFRAGSSRAALMWRFLACLKGRTQKWCAPQNGWQLEQSVIDFLISEKIQKWQTQIVSFSSSVFSVVQIVEPMSSQIWVRRPMKAVWFDALIFDPTWGQNCLSGASLAGHVADLRIQIAIS